MSAHYHIGTAGWNYDHWKGPFYPKERRAGEAGRQCPSIRS